ncbi:hypothetical protein KM176_02435 [Pseudooceanicola sp. CBS1P-1]|uniref:Uncharacterized protein n=1 Tax=Pseudooceanicola albus TaxID=2692189 RepID=A0A6L7FZM8_9RHOB|nr:MULTISPECIES: hypothetical protein [Pseudooceanicola]MBT9382707.1 hypothetical protein [Pseudooceanicola endophyticus]MXN17245.1 hypothetical protein [Pseudooceanicola albus]
MTSHAPDMAEITRLFTDEEGRFRFARWSRPIVPVIFGVSEDSLPPLKGAIESVVLTAGHKLSDMDPELGANLMIFFLNDWKELSEVENMDQLVPELPELLPRLQAAQADQYRFFRFERDNSIRAAFIFLRMRGPLATMPATDLGIEQMVKTMLLWSPRAFRERSPMARVGEGGETVLRPDISALLSAAYDPVLPDFSEEETLSLRLMARAGQYFN